MLKIRVSQTGMMVQIRGCNVIASWTEAERFFPRSIIRRKSPAKPWADSAYDSEAGEKHVLETCDAEEFLMRKGYRNKPLSEGEKRRNKSVSRIRVRAEHVFGRMAQMGMDSAGHRVEADRPAQQSEQSGLHHGPLRLPQAQRVKGGA
jgi:hypothetical protein